MLLLTLPALAFPEDQAATPPMGWNSWNCYGTTVTAEGVLAQAQAIADSGLREKGYVYVVIDDGWQGERDATTGALQGNEAFPDIGALSAQVRALGLRLGIYSTPWPTSYGKFPGGEGHEAEDAWQWARWGIRYLKYDWNPVDPANTRRMRDALASTGAPVIFSLSNTVPQHLAPTWGELANLWRTTSDITDTWDSLERIGFAQDSWHTYAGPGHWNDPDMMVLGWVGWGEEQHYTQLTPDEQRTHVTLWALLGAPLLTGADLTRLDAETLALLTDDDVLEVDQDPAGITASRIYLDGDLELWSRPLSSGATAIGVFNRGDSAWAGTVEWAWLGTPVDQPVRDLWADLDLEPVELGVSLGVPAHGAMLLRVGNAAPIPPAFVGPLWETAEPDQPFGYTVLTSGTRPVTISASGLPEGLTLDGNLITGTAAAGTYDVTLTASNPGGSTSDVLRIEIAEPGPVLRWSASELIASPAQPVTLTWVTTASTVTLDGAPVDPSGSVEVEPDATTTYTLEADGVALPLTIEVPGAEVPLGLRSPGRLRPTNNSEEWQGWEEASEDWSADRNELSVGGVTSLRGLATHAEARLVYPLGGRYRWLSAQVGIDDEVTLTTASVAYTVLGDGEVLWTSDILRPGDGPVDVEVDVSGVEELELQVDDGGDTIDNDHADWLDPVLLIAEPDEPEDSGVPTDTAPTDTAPPDTTDSGDTDTQVEVKDSAAPAEEGGCGCAGAPGGSSVGIVLLGLAATLRRRRGTTRKGGSDADPALGL